MKSMRYDLSHTSKLFASSALAREIEVATIALARFDERLARTEPVLAEGVRARAHFAEAQALIGLGGGLTPLEDLVLHDAGMDVRAPTLEIIKAVFILTTRRSLARRKPEMVLASTQMRKLLGISEGLDDEAVAGEGAEPAWGTSRLVTRQQIHSRINPWDMPRFEDSSEPDDDPPDSELEMLDWEADDTGANVSGGVGDFVEIDTLLARTRRSLASFNELTTPVGQQQLLLSNPAYDQAGRLIAWQGVLQETIDQPAVLATAIALDAWLLLEPCEHQGELGFALAATVLRQRGLAANHLPALAAGLRKSAQGKARQGSGRFRWRPEMAPEARVAGLLAAITQAAQLGQADLDRLTLARELMLRKCVGKSKNSRLAELVDLFTASPLVTVQMAAKALKLSPQGVEAMLAELGASLPRELTGRKRYRAWGIV